MSAPERPRGGPGGRVPLAVFGAWTFFGLVESGNAYVSQRLQGRDRGVWSALVGNMPWWYLWALLTPAVLWVCRRLRPDRAGPALLTLGHLAAGLAFSAVHLLVEGHVFYRTHGHWVLPSVTVQIRNLFLNFLLLDLLTYAAIAGTYYTLDYFRRYREEELAAAELRARAARLEAQTAEARLSALRMELNPHFLFNALNAVSGLVRRAENGAAVEMIGRLGGLLRVALRGDTRHEIPLREELEYLGHYLEIERIRFHDRLTVRVDVDAGLERALVPALILQPLVENAIRHGVAPVPEPGRVTLRARGADAGRLRLEVENTGRALPEGALEAPGVGIRNTLARLDALYCGDASLRLENLPGEGVRATLDLPLRLVARMVTADAAAA
ncbi:MAG TPA: histidine kinase [Longimicrobium sp.]|nr:histidine kinase [Longimicrobium sp.]